MTPQAGKKQNKESLLNPKQVKKTTPGHIIIKSLKTYKSTIKRQICTEKKKIRATADFLLGTIQAEDNGATAFL